MLTRLSHKVNSKRAPSVLAIVKDTSEVTVGFNRKAESIKFELSYDKIRLRSTVAF